MKSVLLKPMFVLLLFFVSYTTTFAQSADQTISDGNKTTLTGPVPDLVITTRNYQAIKNGQQSVITEASLKVFTIAMTDFVNAAPDNLSKLDEHQQLCYNRGDFRELYMYALKNKLNTDESNGVKPIDSDKQPTPEKK